MRRLGEDEPEVGLECELDRAALHVEDARVGAAAVEAEEAGEVEGGGVRGWGALFGHFGLRRVLAGSGKGPERVAAVNWWLYDDGCAPSCLP